jgi:hypothetical protein
MTLMNDAEPVYVTVKWFEDGADGPAWYAWETEYPEEGYFWVSDDRDNKPSPEDLKQICPEYEIEN